MDDSLEELLGVNHRGALEFFFTGLRDAAEGTVDREELLYNASVLAHYAQVSTATDTDFPAPANLAFVFDHFVCGTTIAADWCRRSSGEYPVRSARASLTARIVRSAARTRIGTETQFAAAPIRFLISGAEKSTARSDGGEYLSGTMSGFGLVGLYTRNPGPPANI